MDVKELDKSKSIKKIIMKIKNILMLVFVINTFACKQKENENKDALFVENNTTKTYSANNHPIPTIKDNGQTYFKVEVYKNGTISWNLEGENAFVVSNTSNKIFSIHLDSTKAIAASVTSLSVEFNEVSEGTFPAVIGEPTAKGRPHVNFTPMLAEGRLNGFYLLNNGSVTITKLTNNLVSGNVTAIGEDENKNLIEVVASFINIKPLYGKNYFENL